MICPFLICNLRIASIFTKAGGYNKTFIIFTLVKPASIILSFILMVLSCLPCADAANDSEHSQSTVQNHHHETNDEHSDLCSPFCICNCCGAQILNFTPVLSFVIEPIPAIFSPKPEIGYKSHLASMFSGSIWQPPRIV
ncbi:MAG TPA: hypothetical protein PLS51_04400 [Flavobacterium sp.]|nr:hypothetical protein [Flavobacterium sp.]HPJ09846.1 hypothetical protein [Flavobacterium sp.]